MTCKFTLHPSQSHSRGVVFSVIRATSGPDYEHPYLEWRKWESILKNIASDLEPHNEVTKLSYNMWEWSSRLEAEKYMLICLLKYGGKDD